MYTLYYAPSACSLATHTVLNLLNLPPKLVFASALENFAEINPSKQVPVLQNGEEFVYEGAAILLYLLTTHENNLLPQTGTEKRQGVENIMFANASMHPAYSRLFFINQNVENDETKQALLNLACERINQLWQVVEGKLATQAYLGGGQLSAADILLAVYSRWGAYFPVDIIIGSKARTMIDKVFALDAFQLALAKEQEDQNRYGN